MQVRDLISELQKFPMETEVEVEICCVARKERTLTVDRVIPEQAVPILYVDNKP